MKTSQFHFQVLLPKLQFRKISWKDLNELWQTCIIMANCFMHKFVICNTIKLNRVLQAITCSSHIILKTNLVRLKSFTVILMIRIYEANLPSIHMRENVDTTSCSDSAIWKSSSSEYSSIKAEFLLAAFIWSREEGLTEKSFGFWFFFEETDVEDMLTMTGILGWAFLSSDWANHSRKPAEREKKM